MTKNIKKENNHYKKQVGRFGEDMACEFLQKRGYRIIKRNLQRSYKEIDIVAKKDKLTLFIEVRSRTSTSYGGAEEAINSRKIKNFRAGVKSYAQINNLDFNRLRLDFLAVNINKTEKTVKIRHFKDIA